MMIKKGWRNGCYRKEKVNKVKGNSSQGSIGSAVENTLSPVLCLGYLQRLLLTYRNALVDEKVVGHISIKEQQLIIPESYLIESDKHKGTREQFDLKMIEILDKYDCKLVVLVGYIVFPPQEASESVSSQTPSSVIHLQR